jgi:hypothetical protein
LIPVKMASGSYAIDFTRQVLRCSPSMFGSQKRPGIFTRSGAPIALTIAAAVPDRRARSLNGVYDFREERWVELYIKKIEEMIGVLKSKSVPVLWVGLPALHSPKATADTLFLDALYRGAAEKAAIIYVDVWDGFVDEAGRFMQRGPDFEGQIRQLRSSDGVYFTKPGARKLAHYVEREITRVLRAAPVALPAEPPTPMRIQASLRLGPWQDQLCRCLNLPSVQISCSAARDRRPPCSTRSPPER